MSDYRGITCRQNNLPSKVTAEIVYKFLAAHLVQRWHHNRSVSAFRSGVYYGQRQKGVWNFPVFYTGKPSKITLEPFCHIEWRCQGAKILKWLGIHTFEDMANFDHRTFWQRRLLLKEIVSLEKVGKTFMGHGRKRKPLWTCYEGVPRFNAYSGNEPADTGTAGYVQTVSFHERFVFVCKRAYAQRAPEGVGVVRGRTTKRHGSAWRAPAERGGSDFMSWRYSIYGSACPAGEAPSDDSREFSSG